MNNTQRSEKKTAHPWIDQLLFYCNVEKEDDLTAGLLRAEIAEWESHLLDERMLNDGKNAEAYESYLNYLNGLLSKAVK